MEDKVAIIDLDSVLFSAAFGKKIKIGEENDGSPIYQRDEKGRLVYEDKSEEEMKQSLDDIIIDILTNLNTNKYIAYVKGKSTGAHRYKAYKDYKSKRPKESPVWWNFIKNYSIDRWKAITVDIIEVDDAVNITRLSLDNSIIVAIDKDLLNLEGTHYNWRTNEFITISKEEASFSFWRDMIVGQSGDGVPGLPGKGQSYYINNIRNNITDIQQLPIAVLSSYIKYLGESEGIQLFYSNYQCLKILDKYEDEIYTKVDKKICLLENEG